jgi:hypothetical protein
MNMAFEENYDDQCKLESWSRGEHANRESFFSTESVVINFVFAKTGAWECAEQLLLTQLAAFTLATDNFFHFPVLFSE